MDACIRHLQSQAQQTTSERDRKTLIKASELLYAKAQQARSPPKTKAKSPSPRRRRAGKAQKEMEEPGILRALGVAPPVPMPVYSRARPTTLAGKRSDLIAEAREAEARGDWQSAADNYFDAAELGDRKSNVKADLYTRAALLIEQHGNRKDAERLYEAARLNRSK